ncbi:hypothetical protein HPP92_000974 [Vanilla planifolia]|uniref:Bifunctional inhibitor/plant lipid transfer protein/seed storage helical domain-containing protein n=1 Tax=Vanilla planifolia TaxID=51239 RepID=A0A835VGH8_VANPL|nr:hypothetical protein HPP92_000974 [Vanilla planifolia]
MAHRIPATMAIVAITTILMGGVVEAQSDDCNAVLFSLSPCLSYITGNSSTPSAPCCSQFAVAAQTDQQCLCMVVDGGAWQFGIPVNRTQALALPGECKVQTPFSSCKTANVPTPSVSPSTGGNSSGGNSAGSILQPMFPQVLFHVVIMMMVFLSMPSWFF